MPVSKNKRTTRKRIRLNKKAKRQPKTMSLNLIKSYRSMYMGIGISFIVISLFLMLFGEGTYDDEAVSAIFFISGLFSLLGGKFASDKSIKKSKSQIKNTDLDVF